MNEKDFEKLENILKKCERCICITDKGCFVFGTEIQLISLFTSVLIQFKQMNFNMDFIDFLYNYLKENNFDT